MELQAYEWPGNVRELQNVIERAAILGRGERLAFSLSPGPRKAVQPAELPEPGPGDRVLSDGALRDLERRNLLQALGRAGWRIQGEGGAAEILGVKPTTLCSRMKALGIEKPE